MIPALFRISTLAEQAVPKIQALPKIMNAAKSISAIPSSLNIESQIWRILNVMAELKKKQVVLLPFELAKEALSKEKTIVTLFENNGIRCTEFFANLWSKLCELGYIVILK